MEALLEGHHFLKNQTTPTTGCQQAAPTNENQPRKRCQRQPESDDMQPDTSRAHHHKQDEMQPDPSRAPTSSTIATVIATNTQSYHLEDLDVLYDPRRRDIRLETDTTVFSEPDWEEINPVAPRQPTTYSTPDFQNTPKMVYHISCHEDNVRHVMNLIVQAYDKRARVANRPLYKRYLYDLYLWERGNIDKTVNQIRETLMQMVRDKHPKAIMQFGPSC